MKKLILSITLFCLASATMAAADNCALLDKQTVWAKHAIAVTPDHCYFSVVTITADPAKKAIDYDLAGGSDFSCTEVKGSITGVTCNNNQWSGEINNEPQNVVTGSVQAVAGVTDSYFSMDVGSGAFIIQGELGQ